MKKKRVGLLSVLITMMLLFTGCGGNSTAKKEARDAGVTAFCSKPMFMSDLRETLMTAIGQQEIEKADMIPHTGDTDRSDRTDSCTEQCAEQRTVLIESERIC